MEGLIYEGKFAFQNRFRASLIVGSNLPFLLCFTLYLRAIFQVKAPGRGGGGALYFEDRFNGGFLALPVCRAHGGAYFRNFTVFPQARPSVVNLFLNDSSFSAFCRLS